MQTTSPASGHPFVTAPHRTLIALSFPVLVSLVAEPVTGLVDTAFVSRLGPAPLAALGVGTVVLSSVFWIFNFLGIGTQTEVARSSGAGRIERAREVAGLALALGAGMGLALLVAGIPLASAVASLMGASGRVHDGAVIYLAIRLLGTPALLAMTVAFGALRGLQDMRTPLWIAVSVNAVNAVLDAMLVLGLGPIPAYGIAGAAWATVASNWAGAVWAFLAMRSKLGLPSRLRARDAGVLLVVGRDLFLRTGLLTAFLLLATRSATRIGAEAGAAHQAIRQVWLLAALVLDAYAATAQSLVGYFLGALRADLARRVAAVSCQWSFVTGLAITAAMLGGQEVIGRILVPQQALGVFGGAWIAAAIFQPLNALSFATDGIHWGAGDYRYLRNAMAAATLTGIAALFAVDEARPGALTMVWIVTGVWITVRMALGVARIWPGLGDAPLRAGSEPAEP